jgi:hypothetical protein
MKLVSEVTDFSIQFSLTVQSFYKVFHNIMKWIQKKKNEKYHSVKIILNFSM